MFRRFIVTMIMGLMIIVLASCGGSTRTINHTVTVVATNTAVSCNPAPNQGHMGVCTPRTQTLGPLPTLSGSFIPDVYELNGCKNWAGSKGHIAGGIVKAFEFRTDHCLAQNWASLTRAKIWHAAYDFLRPGSCTGEADAYVSAVRHVGGFNSGPAIGDAEVALPAGFVACWVARIKHDTDQHTVIIYTAPGTWPGGGNPGADLWVATYGPVPGCVWTCTHIAWQFTDGTHGPLPHSTLIGTGDISINNGITKILAKPLPKPKPKPHLVCFGKKAQLHNNTCKKVRSQDAGYQHAVTASRKALKTADHTLSSNHCRKPYRRTICRRAGGLDKTFRHRITYFGAKSHALEVSYS